jgi:hypothetical protein
MNIYSKTITISSLLAVFLIFTLLFVTNASAQSQNATSSSVKIFPPSSKPYGLSYEDHVKNYWKFTLAIPKATHPWMDKTGEKCRFGQESSNSSIFYLPTNDKGFSKRTCKIPGGSAVFIPVIVGEMSLLEVRQDNPNVKIGDLPGIAKDDHVKITNLKLRINDKNFNEDEIRKYGVLTSVFNVTFADNGLFGVVDGGPTVAAGDGYYVITEPLSKGTYIINPGGQLCADPTGCLADDYLTNVNTTLIVE